MSEDVSAKLRTMDTRLIAIESWSEKKDKEILEIVEDVREVKKDNADIWKWFLGSIFSLLAILLSVLGLMFTKIEKISDSTSVTREAVVRLEGKLDPYNFSTE